MTHNLPAAGVNVTSPGIRSGPSAAAKDTQGQSKGGRTVPAPLSATFRAFWPITDTTAAPHHLIADALDDLPWLTAQAHAVIVGPGRWYVEDSAKVPGSGRVTPWVLLYEAPAIEGRAPFADSAGEVA